MIDRGNDSFLRAAERHYDAMHSDECECARCGDHIEVDDETLHDGDEYYCDDICARTELWAYDFVREVLFEDEGERSAFFAPITPSILQAAE